MRHPGPAQFRLALMVCAQARNDIATILASVTVLDEAPEQAMHALDADALIAVLAALLARESLWAVPVAHLCAESLRRVGDTMAEHSQAASAHGRLLSDARQIERLATGWLGTPKDKPTGGPYAA